MNKNENGFSFVEILVVIVIVGLIVAVGWLVYDRKNKANNTSTTNSGSQTNTKITSNTTSSVPSGLVKYSSKELGISFYYPREWGEAQENVTDNTNDGETEVSDGSYLGIVFSNKDLQLASVTKNYKISKGPLPASYSFMNGFTEEEISEWESYPESTTKVTEINGKQFVYVESVETFTTPESIEYFYATNLDTNQYAGLTISTYDKSDLEQINQLLETITF